MKLLLPLVLLFTLLGSCSKLGFLKNVHGVKKQRSPFHISWAKNLDPTFDTGNLPIALNSPLIYQDTVFVGKANGEFMAYDAERGSVLWSAKDKGGHHSIPLGYKDNIIYGTDQGRVYSRNAITGKLNYSVDLDEAIESQGVHHKGRLFFHTRNHKLFSLDIETGRILWAYKRSVGFLTTMQRASTPLAYDNKLYVGFADGIVAAFAIDDGSLLWEARVSEGTKFVDVDARPLMWNKMLVVSSNLGKLTFLDPISGNVRRRIQKAAYRSPLILSNGNLAVGTTHGSVVLIGNDLNVIKEVKLSKVSISNIRAWKGGYLVATMSRKLYLLDSKFATKGVFDLGHEYSSVFGEIDISDEFAAVLSSRNRLYIFN